MTRDKAREFAKVVQAYADGKDVQFRRTDDTFDWIDCVDCMAFEGIRCEYRIKPEPREWWEVLDRDGDCVRRRKTREDAEVERHYLERNGSYAPYTIVHMREVTE